MPVDGDTFFGPWEGVVSDWADALGKINSINDLATGRRVLVWRGVVNAGWSLHSSLYRRVAGELGAPPDESDLLARERQILDHARRRWRFDNLPSLELLAHIQHYGGPTRMLDVTYNPLIALWFAVEQKFDDLGNSEPEADGRMFAFDVTDRQIDLDGGWRSRDLPWESMPAEKWRRALPSVWRPPSYNERIPAQNSAFLLGGVPMMYAGDNSKYYRKRPGKASTMGMWSIAEVREATSIPMRMNSLNRGLRKNATPTFTLRIGASSKAAIRDSLERRFGFDSSTIYPDLFGLATHVLNG